MSASSLQILPCPLDDRGAALRLLYRHMPEALRPRMIADVLDETERGLIDLSGLWIARRRGRIAGVLLTQMLAGHAAGVWAPEVDLKWGRSGVAVALIRAALADLRARGYRIAQALLEGAAPSTGAADLTRGGLPRITELIYMGRDTAPPLEIGPGVPSFRWRPYGPETEDEFVEVLRGTYAGSLDMPELEGFRSLDDVLASHRAGGRFVPERWRIGRLDSDPTAAAILLLSELPGRDVWEVAYLGLTPSARGLGLGRSSLAHALDLARPHAPRIELAVDIRNHPARRLYRNADFIPFGRRYVHLATLA